MRAIIDATGYREKAAPLLYYKPSPLLHVCGKPIIIHIIEFLVQQGVSHVDIVLNYLPEKIESELGSGRRWGINIAYHLVRNSQLPFQVVRLLPENDGQVPVFFALGDSLPCISSKDMNFCEEDLPILYFYPEGMWTGWGIFFSNFLADISFTATEENLLKIYDGKYTRRKAQPFLDMHTVQGFYDSNQRFLSREHAGLVFPTAAKNVEPGIWISRGVSLHPGSKIIPPVFIGEFCQIGAKATIGPHAVVEDFCIVDKESDVVHSVVCRHSYVGESLSISNSVVDRNLLISLSLDAQVTICDSFILGESYPRHSFRWLFHLLERFAAGALFVLLFPFYLLMHCDHHLRREVVLKLPASHDPMLWETVPWETFDLNAGRKLTVLHKLFSRLPLLKGVFKGYIHFIGMKPRPPKDVEKLPSDWKKLYLRSKLGIITAVDSKDQPDEDLCYASELMYAINKSPWLDFQLLLKWFLQKCKQIMR